MKKTSKNTEKSIKYRLRPLVKAWLLCSLLAASLLLWGCGEGGSAEQTVPSGETSQEASESASSSAGGESGDASAGGGVISWEEAQAIALERVPGATVANIGEMETEYDDGRTEYEGSIYYNGYEYEFEIDGTTGNILKWEIDD